MNHIGHYFQQVRESRGLSRDDVARQLGCSHLQKGVRRLAAFEATGTASDGFKVKLTEVLGLDWCEVEEVADSLYWLGVVADEC